MSNDANTFPLFLPLKFDDGGAFPALASALNSMQSAADGSAKAIKTSLTQAVVEASNLAKSVASVPLGPGGKLDLGVVQYQEAAAGAERTALAARELADAYTRVTTAAGGVGTSLTLEAKGFAVAADEAERLAVVARQQAIAVASLQGELGRSQLAARVEAGALDAVTESTGNAAIARAELLHVVRASSDAFAAGLPVTMILGEEIGRLGEAAALSGGALGSVGTFFAGPWGIALTAGLAVLTPLVGKLLESGDAANGAADGLHKHAEAAKTTEQAIKDLNTALGKSIESERNQQISSYNAAQALEFEERQTRNLTQAKLADVNASLAKDRADIRAGRNSTDFNRSFRIQQGPSTAASLSGQIVGQNAALALAQQNVRLAQIPILQQSVKEATDKAAAAQGRFNREQDRLNELFSAGKISADQYQASLTKAQDVLDASKDKSDRAAKGHKGLTEAEREAEAAARDLAAEQRALDQALDAIVKQFDPARAAAQAYADTLSDIARLQTAGKLGIGDRVLYDFRADQKEALTQQSVANDNAKQLYKELGIDPGADLNGIVDAIDSTTKGMIDAGTAGGHALRASGTEAARAIADTLGIRLKGNVGGLLSLFTTPTSALNPFDQGRAQALQPLRELSGSITSVFGKGGDLDKTLGNLIGSAQFGQLAGGLLLGSSGSKPGEAFGGALGNVAGKALGTQFGKQLGKLAGLAGPIGSVVGGLLGGVIGGLFKKIPKAAATFSIDQYGNVSNSVTGNTSGARSTATQEASGVISGIQQVAQQLGASLNSGAPLASIGNYNGKYRVSTSGSSKLGGYSGSASQNESQYGLYNFDDDEQAAIAFAIQTDIQNGVLKGISAASQKILAPGQDLNTAITKAVAIENIPKQLKAITDPVGSAIDTINQVSYLQEGGATAEQFAQAQNLYDLQRADAIKQATDETTSALKSLISDLTVGNDAHSLQDRLAAAQAVYNPLAAQAQNGMLAVSDYQDFTDAARNVVDISRQLYGSQQGYFDTESSILALTQKIESAQEAINTSAANSGTPFDGTNVVNAIGSLSDALLAPLNAVNENLGRVVTAIQTSGFDGSGSAASVARLNF
jgi:hypothetical protein